MFDPSREQARDFFFETWRRYRAGEPLAAMERMTLEVMLAHAEYHPELDAPERYRELNYFPELGQTNPFLHMSMHLAIEEQLSIDQPAGIAARLATLARKRGDRHAALHDAMECLAEMVWRSQRDRAPPDAAAYLDCVEKRSQR